MSKHVSKTTKKYRALYWLFQIIDWVIIWLPLIIYFFIALADGGVTASRKVVVVTAFAAALVLVVFNVITRHHLRAPLWFAILGLYIAINKLLPLIIMIAVGTIIDELFFRPQLKKLEIKLEASKTVDEHYSEV